MAPNDQKQLGLENEVSKIKVNSIMKHKKQVEVSDGTSEVKQVECKCCGLEEECTESYIKQIKRTHSGKWVCGLCSEAVKETIKKSPKIAVKEAVMSHMDFCNRYNSTIRLNPKLSFTCDMRDIAKRSGESRISPDGTSAISKLGRTSSCAPRIDLSQY